MTNKDIINITVISNGEREFNGDEILNDKMLYSFVSKNIVYSPASLLEQIRDENGTLLMITNLEFTKFRYDLRDVSQELYTLFRERYK